MRAACLGAASALAVALAPAHSWSQEKADNLDQYLTDFNAGMVSAGNLVGLQDSPIQEIQTSQDLIFAFKPFSSPSSKRTFGIAITPARTTITPMSAREYRSKWYMRLLGATTLSYAESATTISSIEYAKYAFSVDTSYYWQTKDDPILVAQDAFGRCETGLAIERKFARAEAAKERNQEALKAAQDELAKAVSGEDKAKAQAEIDKAKDAIAVAQQTISTAPSEAEAAVRNCIEAELAKAKWNAHRLSIGFGTGYIRPEDNAVGSKESLGRATTFGAVIGVGKQGAFNLTLRHTSKEVDPSTLAGTPQYKSSSLAAARYTWGSNDKNGDLKVLAEISNADKNEVTESNRVFMHALGVDKRIGKGTWLQFRVGRSQTADGNSTETTGFLALNFAPTTGLFK